MDKQPTILSTSSLAIGYPNRQQPYLLAEDLNLTLRPGELTCLLGTNGIGKSTLMRTLAGMQAPLSGTVMLENTNIQHLKASQLAQKVSVVLTHNVEVGNLSAYSVVAMGRYPYTGWLGQLRKEDKQVVAWAIETTSIAHLVHKQLYQLSDGERQKVMIARALAQDTPLILLDEPTVHLDLPNRMSIVHLLRTLVKETGKSVLMSTHGLDLALQCADKIWLMYGHTIQSGIPEDLILNGAIKKVFQKEGLQFDMASGTFRLQQALRSTVHLDGHGPAYIWTQRALERTGYGLAPEGTFAPAIKVVEENGKLLWWLTYDDFFGKYTSLADVLTHLDMVSLQYKTVKRDNG